MTATEAARGYIARGFAPLPLPPRQKKAVLRDWPNFRANTADLSAFDGGNVGLLLGEPSGGLVDVDLDTPEAVAAAALLLPKTGMTSGRAGSPRSHYWFRCPDAPRKASTGFADVAAPGADPDRPAEARQLLVELRSTGGQTVVAPSVHPSGEAVVWHEAGDPAVMRAADLLGRVVLVAVVALAARHWPGRGVRQDAFLALAGGLARSGVAGRDAADMVRALAVVTADDEVAARVQTVERTYERVHRGGDTTGWPKLAGLLGAQGHQVVALARDWLARPAEVPRPGPGVPGSKVAAGPRFRLAEPYVPFPTRALPEPWGRFCDEVARILKCDGAYPALPVLSVLAGAVGGKRRVVVGPGWTEPAVIWTAIVTESGGKKSPAADYVLGPVEERQERLHAEYRREVADWDALYGGRRGADAPAPPRPTARRILVGDVTIEKLATMLEENPAGLLQHRDELAGWIGSLTRYKGASGGSDEANWLTIHGGRLLCYDRKTGTHLTVSVPNACVSLFGGIPPARLAALMHKGLRDSGLSPRLLYAHPPKTRKEYVEEDMPPELRDAADRSLSALYALEAEATDDGRRRPVLVRLAPDALARWKRFVNEWGWRTYEATGDRASAFSKLEGYTARFALVHHLAEGGDGRPVGLRSVEAGIALAAWFADEGERVYALFAETEDEAELRRFAESVARIAARRPGGLVAARDLQKANGKKYRTAGEAELALETLVAAGAGAWVDRPDAPGGQACKPAFRFHPPAAEPEDTADDGGAADDFPPPSDDSTGPGGSGPGDPPPAGTESYCPPGGYGGGVAEEACDPSDMSDAGPRPSAPTVPAPPVAGAEPRGSVSGRTRATSAGYTLVADASELGEVEAAVRASARVGLDTETTGLDPRADTLCLLSLSTDAGVFLVDCTLVDPAPLWPALAAAEVVGHNLAFDLQFLARRGFAPGRCFDTMLASQVLEAGDRAARHGLKDAAARLLGVAVDKAEQRADWSGPLTTAMLAYAAADAQLPLRLREAMLEKSVGTKLGGVFDLENTALPTVAWASGAGVGFDREAWQALAVAARVEADRMRGRLNELLPAATDLFGAGERNWDSPAAVQEAFRAAGVALESTGDDALAAAGHPAAAALRDYRGAAKMSATYGAAWLKHAAPGGRVHCRWRQAGTMSGRMSCADPNLQNLPRDPRYRRCFTAPPGRVLVKADYSQIELRLAAKIAGDRAMIAAYARGDDLHALTARQVLGRAEVTKADRQTAKAVNFGLLFGAGAKTLAAYARSSYGVAMTEAEAGVYRRKFFATYPGLRAWHDRAGATRCLAVCTHTVLGRRRSGVTSFTEKLNSPVQGSAADGLKAALALLWERRAECPTAVPVLFVHDEVVVEVDEAGADAARAWLVGAMVDGMRPFCDPVPVEVEATVARTWGGD